MKTKIITKMKFAVAASLAVIPGIALAHTETGYESGLGAGMMGWGGMMGGGWSIFILLQYLVWLIVGIFAAIWLWQKITKK